MKAMHGKQEKTIHGLVPNSNQLPTMIELHRNGRDAHKLQEGQEVLPVK
jgi:hypothetical protein